MHAEHGLSTPDRFTNVRDDLDPDARIDHIVELSPPGAERHRGASNFLGEQRGNVAVGGCQDVVAVWR